MHGEVHAARITASATAANGNELPRHHSRQIHHRMERMLTQDCVYTHTYREKNRARTVLAFLTIYSSMKRAFSGFTMAIRANRSRAGGVMHAAIIDCRCISAALHSFREE